MKTIWKRKKHLTNTATVQQSNNTTIVSKKDGQDVYSLVVSCKAVLGDLDDQGEW